MRRESLSHGVRTSCCRPCRIWRLGSGLQLQHGSVRGAGQHPLRRHPHGHRCPDRHGHACTGQVPAHQLLPEPACSSAHMWILLHAPRFQCRIMIPLLCFGCRFGSEELKQQFLRPSIAGDVVACLGVSEVGAGSDVSSLSIFFIDMIHRV